MSVRDEHGFTLVELLVVMTISLVILGATLTTFNTSYQAQHDNDVRSETAERAREALDVQARQLRNLAKRLNNTAVIETLGDYDLIFQTSDPNRTWVRYCLDTTSAPASSSRGRLWTAELSLPVTTTSSAVTAEMKSGCPGSGWTTTRVVADHVTNTMGGLDRPLFGYTCTPDQPAQPPTSWCTASPSTYDRIVNISARTIVDSRPGRGAAELIVTSGVYLRNQNQAPQARFVATPSSTSRTVVLNASGSTDFENRRLNYYWFKHTLPTPSSIDCTIPRASGSTMWDATYLGEGITLSHTFAPEDGAAGTTRNIGLVACDPGDRYGTAGIPPQATIAVQIPN